MRRLLPLFLTGLLILALAGCGGKETSPAQTADMEAMQTALLAADPTLPEMRSITGQVGDAETLFTYVSDLPYEKVDDFLLSYSAEGKADEIAVIAVKDPADAEAAADTLRAHLDQRLTLFRQYSPDEVSRAEKALVFTQDQYAVLLICDGNQDVKAAFEEFLTAAQ